MIDHVGWSITSYPKCNAATVCLILSFSSEPLSGSTIAPHRAAWPLSQTNGPISPFVHRQWIFYPTIASSSISGASRSGAQNQFIKRHIFEIQQNVSRKIHFTNLLQTEIIAWMSRIMVLKAKERLIPQVSMNPMK
ncbi:hypothetical protein EmuJ_000125300 [Echinococcus multilocularis]|uniref:Uncharacterized protein n=1 Tax=Echinococcus multilocularis TaxID=6211 RepID=A0A087VYT6_ECHMU|nr:hypothetical protein EmuJ_000125300 [Echinococcus multilocularis]